MLIIKSWRNKKSLLQSRLFLFGTIMKEFHTRVYEQMLEAEMDNLLGYEYIYKRKNVNFFIVKVGRPGKRLSGRSFFMMPCLILSDRRPVSLESLPLFEYVKTIMILLINKSAFACINVTK